MAVSGKAAPQFRTKAAVAHNRASIPSKQQQQQPNLHHHHHHHHHPQHSHSFPCPSSRKQGHATFSWLAFSVTLNALFLSAFFVFPASVRQLWRPHIEQQQQHPLGCMHCEVQRAPVPLSHQLPCSGQGQYEFEYGGHGPGRCRCHTCFRGEDCSELVTDCLINFDHGDPKMFETYWSANKDATATVLLGGERMSYFSNTDSVCWFLEPALASEIKLLHKLVGNAVTEGRTIIAGTGSSQLIHAALYAVSSTYQGPVDVISAAPFYSSYPPMTDYLQSGLHKWAGDALQYMWDHVSPYIEFVTSPGNPDGLLHVAVVNGTGKLIHDLAYYWPHYTPIIRAADHDIMLFTVSKGTGHAGTRIGWALVRDTNVAKRMTKYIELNTIGVSKDSQLRASRIIKSIRSGYSEPVDGVSSIPKQTLGSPEDAANLQNFFSFGYWQMESRWKKLLAAVNGSSCFSVEKLLSAYCRFFAQETCSHPAFAWLRCLKHKDCHALFKAHGIVTRSGIHFGSSSEYIRISMVDHEKIFDLFVSRLQNITDCTSS